MEKSEILEFVKHMKAKEHAIVFYSKPEDKHQVLLTFVKEGLERGEAVGYAAGGESPDSLREAMKRFGIDVERYEKSSALIIMKEMYIEGGKGEPSEIIARWKRLYDEAIAKGFKGLRATGETDHFFHSNLVKDLVRYEEALHRELDFPMTALCGYNTEIVANYGRGQLYLDLIKAHRTVIFTGPEAGVVKSY